MQPRQYSLLDRFIAEADHALRVVAAKPRAARKAPGTETQPELAKADKELSARLMRVNHSGEIAAQALYRGQALVAREPALQDELLEAAEEEHDHLAWCEDRTRELGSRVSLLAPAWYAGSFAIGTIAGLAGDKISLGFLAETEKQVTDHLEGHLQRLPAGDSNSRAIIEQMRKDEIKHGQNAAARGGEVLPEPVKSAMRAVAKVMTTVSFRL